MGKFEKKMIELGAIDTPIERLEIDEWFENVTIAFQGQENIGNVMCIFKQCYEVSLKHDVTYDKGKNSKGELNYKYFIQDIHVEKYKEFLCFKISAWPLEGKILCKEISIEVNGNSEYIFK
ncbi:MAG: hypothetical protein HDR00_01795 [Lachnospiraceae bacterium]|nr:hypothetical protein [Lachnospiraceae bacterium]